MPARNTWHKSNNDGELGKLRSRGMGGFVAIATKHSSYPTGDTLHGTPRNTASSYSKHAMTH